MSQFLFVLSAAAIGLVAAAARQDGFEEDVISTSGGDLKITFLGHSTMILSYAGQIIHVDPVSAEADYAKLPKADLILVTHEHYDHLDIEAIRKIRTPGTAIVTNRAGAAELRGATGLGNGESTSALGLRIEAVPAYNIKHMRSAGQPFHPKGQGNGYIVTFGDKRVYIAGDTENTPEMKALKDIEVAFLPMNLPYTMSPEMVADAVRAFKPKIVYPVHLGLTDTAKLAALLKGEKGIEVRIRKMI